MAEINNQIYEQLQHRWYHADDDPVALLRAEARARNPWVQQRIWEAFGRPVSVLDLGCGAGFLSNALVKQGHRVTGVDQAENALQVARAHDSSGSVKYELGDARSLAYGPESFDVVCAMDVLEHVVEWPDVVAEAARVLKPGGLFVYYTFNRTLLAWLFAAKGIEWVVKNTPKHLHLHAMFITPAELSAGCAAVGLQTSAVVGFGPRVFSRAFARLLLTGKVPTDFEFHLRKGTQLGYLGVARKAASIAS